MVIKKNDQTRRVWYQCKHTVTFAEQFWGDQDRRQQLCFQYSVSLQQ